MGKRLPYITDVNHPDYPHGTPLGHRRVKHVCEACKQAYRRRQKQTIMNRGRGVRSYVPAGAALGAHLRDLIEQGGPAVTAPAVAAVANIDIHAVRSVMKDPAYMLNRESAARLAALAVEDVAASVTRVDIRPVRQMVVEMNANGHNDTVIARHTGCTPRAIAHIRAARNLTISKAIAEGVRDAYIDLGSTHGDSEDAKQRAFRVAGIRKPPADAAADRHFHEIKFEIMHGIVSEGLTIAASIERYGHGVVKTMDKQVRSLGLRTGRDSRMGAPISEETFYLVPTIRDAISDVRYYRHDPVQRWAQLREECEALVVKRAARAYAATHAQAA